LQEVRKIWRASSMQSFDGQSGQFKPYSPFNRKAEDLIEKFV